MTRYSNLYYESQEALQKARAALAESEQTRESYRLFIYETRRVREFMMWWAHKMGFSDQTMLTLEEAFAKESPAVAGPASGEVLDGDQNESPRPTEDSTASGDV